LGFVVSVLPGSAEKIVTPSDLNGDSRIQTGSREDIVQPMMRYTIWKFEDGNHIFVKDICICVRQVKHHSHRKLRYYKMRIKYLNFDML